MAELDKDLQEIIDVVAEGVRTGQKAFADGVQAMDAFAFVPVLTKVPEAVKDAKNALHYLKDMSEEKETVVVDAVAKKLGDASELVKGAARRILRLLAEGYMTYDYFNDHYNSTKKPVPPTA